MRKFARVRSLVVDVSPLRESRPYRALWIGQVVSLLGTHMRFVAVPFQVFEITQSTVAVGLISLAELIPLIVFSIVGGALADTFDRRKIMAVSQIGLLLNSAALAALTFTSTISLPWIYVLVAIGGAVDALDRPARNAIIPHLVRPEKLPAAMALRQVVFHITHIAGPAIGGVLLGVLASVGWVYVVDAVTFLGSFIALRWVPASRPEPEGEAESTGVGWTMIKEGLSYAFRMPVILSIFIIDLVAMIFGMPRAVFPELAQETFAVGPAGLGILYAAPAIGGLIAALTTGWVSSVRRSGLAVIGAVAVWGAAITMAGFSTFSFVLTITFLAVAGGADVVSAVFRSTMVLETTPDPLRGRVGALNMMVVTGGPRIGDIEAGLVAGAVGAPASVVIGGVACLIGTAGVAASFPALRSYTSRAALVEEKE